jgi:DNA repair exonuclease SbcCD ATPase subunit
MNATYYRSLLERQKGKRDQIKKMLSLTKENVKQDRKSLVQHEQARELIREAGLKTQGALSFQISEITSLALEAVFDNPYTLEVDFVQRRNKTECDLYFSRDGNRVEPMEASGGGAVDIASFALRIASWAMMRPHLRNTIILDEPMKNLSAQYQEKGSLMLKEVSKRLGIQFIIVTHEEMLASYADRTFLVSINKKGVSRIKIIENEPEYSDR